MNLSKNLRNKILLITFIAIGVLFAFLNFTNYQNGYRRAEESALNQLSSYLSKKYKNKDDISTNNQDSIYLKIHSLLKNTHKINNLNTSIYTMVYDSLNNMAYFVVSSSDKPFYKHNYKGFTKELISNYSIGAKIKSYEDEHGEWLSAFAPIKNKANKTVAVVQTDFEFTNYVNELRKELFKEIFISVIILFISLYFIYNFLNKILITQSKLHDDLKAINHEISESINYAKYFFNSVITKPEEISKHVSNSFIYYKPKDIIGGDFYVFYPLQVQDGVCTKYAIGVFDCTGHGVSGGILAMLGLSIVQNLTPLLRTKTPAVVLGLINNQFMATLNNGNIAEAKHAGMEGCLCVVDKNINTISFSGAKSNLHIINSKTNELTILKANRVNIGDNSSKEKFEFTNHTTIVNEGDNIYLFSDGITDQYVTINGKNQKLKTKPFISYLINIKNLKMDNQLNMLTQQLSDWMNDNNQTDDLTIIGFSI